MRLLTSTLLTITLLLLGCGTTQAGTDLNEVGALLVFPMVKGLPNSETYLAVTSTGSSAVNVHITFIDGFEGTTDEPNPNYCFECDFSIPLTANDTELLVVKKSGNGSEIVAEDGTIHHSCPIFVGMVVATIEGPDGTLTDNILLGSEVVVDYANGLAYSVSAIPFQGRFGGDGDRAYSMDDAEYGKLPRVVATDFIAPDPGNVGPLTAELALFTLGFETEFPPVTDCDIQGYDAAENPFSRSFEFGCWTMRSLWDLHTEFAYGNLGQIACEPGVDCHSHGWLMLDCRVDSNADGVFDVVGGVHGAIVQKAPFGTPVRAPFNGVTQEGLAWSRLLYQSVSTGGNVALRVAGPGGGLN